MKVGKLTSEALKRVVFSKLSKKSHSQLNMPAIGEDVAYVGVGDEILVLSTDPITGADRGAGSLAIHIGCNDIAAGGGTPLAVMLTILAPPSVTEEKIGAVMEEASRAAESIGVDIIGGHTEVTSSVKRLVLSTTVLGKADRVLPGPKEGDAIIMTKCLGLEGTAIIAQDRMEMKQFLSPDELKDARSMEGKLSVLPESKLALKYNVNSMHDVTEGGLVGALCEIVYERDFGFVIYEDRVNMHPVTEKMASYYEIDPYQLISSGSMLISLNQVEAEPLIKDLRAAGIEAEIIGSFIKDKKTVMVDKDGKERKLVPKVGDELYRVIGHEES